MRLDVDWSFRIPARLAAGLALGLLISAAAPPAGPSAQERQDLTKPFQYEVSVALKLINVYVTNKRPAGRGPDPGCTATDDGRPVKLTEFEKHFLGAPPEKAAAADETADKAGAPAPAPAALSSPASTRKFFLFFDFAFDKRTGTHQGQDGRPAFPRCPGPAGR